MVGSRVTMGAAYALAAATAVSRVTMAPAYVLIAPSAASRVTMAAAYVVVKRETPPCLTRECDCWKITRTDGEVFGFTSHNRPVDFEGVTYVPWGSLSSSALQLSGELGSTDNVDLSGVFSAAGITAEDVWAGRFDGASVEIYRVSWDGSTPSTLITAGNCGRLEFGDTGYRYEVVTAGERLQERAILRQVMPSCRFVLGGPECGVDLEALRETGSVDLVAPVNIFTQAHRREFTDAARLEPDGYWTLGRITFTSGDNDGLSADVKSFEAGVFVLDRPLPHAIAPGDAYSITPGCDRTFATCDSTFDNTINFGGFPYLKGSDDLAQVPPVKE